MGWRRYRCPNCSTIGFPRRIAPRWCETCLELRWNGAVTSSLMISSDFFRVGLRQTSGGPQRRLWLAMGPRHGLNTWQDLWKKLVLATRLLGRGFGTHSRARPTLQRPP